MSLSPSRCEPPPPPGPDVSTHTSRRSRRAECAPPSPPRPIPEAARSGARARSRWARGRPWVARTPTPTPPGACPAMRAPRIRQSQRTMVVRVGKAWHAASKCCGATYGNPQWEEKSERQGMVCKSRSHLQEAGIPHAPLAPRWG